MSDKQITGEILDEDWDDFDFPVTVFVQPNGDRVVLDDMPRGWELDMESIFDETGES